MPVEGVVGQAPSAPAKPPVQGGLVARARLALLAARKQVQMALALIDDTSSEEGKAAIGALKALQGISGDVQGGLGESEAAAVRQGVTPQPAAQPGAGGAGGGMAGPAPSYPLGRSEQGFMGTGYGA